MKTILSLCLISILLLFFVRYTKIAKSREDVQLEVCVTPKILYLNNIKNSIKFTIRNLSDKHQYRGDFNYKMEYFNETDWDRINLNMTIYALEMVIEPNKIQEIDVPLKQIMENDSYKFTSGLYRINYNGWCGEFKIF